jgi:hypothetical protein
MLRFASLLLAALLALSCAPEAERAAARELGTPVTPTRTVPADRDAPAPAEPVEPGTQGDGSPAPAPETNVVITRPKEGETVSSNPIRVEGRARTFENNVELHVDNEHDETLATGFTTARGELGSFNPFSTEIFLTSDPGSEITIIALERSAGDGSVRTRHAVPVRVGARKAPLRLFFPNANRSGGDCTAVERVVREVPVSVSSARLALEALLRGPTQPEVIAGFRSTFPEGAAIRTVNLRRGTLTVDFNEAMQNVGGSCRVQSIRASIDRTMKEIPGIRRVVITAMGDGGTALQP